MRVLVTGASGQVASCLSRLGGGHPNFDLNCVGRPQLDVTLRNQVVDAVAAYRPDILVNAAAYTDVERAEEVPVDAFAVNYKGALNLARTAGARNIPLIHISTDYVFSGDKEAPYLESDEVGPINVYGQSKLDGENAIQSTLDDFVILRTSWVYSPFGKNFLRTMIGLFQTRDQINVVDDQYGSPTSAWDIAQTILEVCAARGKGNRHSGVYHLAGSGVTTWHGFAKAISHISEVSGKRHAKINPIPSSAFPTIVKRPRNSALNTNKLLADFGIKLRPWYESLEHCHQQVMHNDCFK